MRYSSELIETQLQFPGVRFIRDLGGRLNHHWLVERNSERLVLRRWAEQSHESIEYERRVVQQVAALGWPVAPLTEPVEVGGRLWSFSPALPGEPIPRTPAELRARGRLLAEFHAATATMQSLAQRPGWRRAEEILADPLLDETLAASEASKPKEIQILRWHLDRARLRAEQLDLARRPSVSVHGDFATWNLLFQDGQLTGLFDFELSHQDHRVADFNLAWRGKYDEFIQGYEEVSRLEPIEKAALVPIWWASLIETAYQNLQNGFDDHGWAVGKLLTRSPSMGPDARCLPS